MITSEGKSNLSPPRKIMQDLRKFIQLNTPHTNKHTAYDNLLAYADRKIDMLERFRNEPIECVAWIARNLYEASLWVRYLGKDEQKAEMFIRGALVAEDLDILKRFSELEIVNPIPAVVVAKEKIGLQRAVVEQFIEQNDIQVESRIKTGDLANLVGDNSYKALYAFYSKHVHASPWLINSTRENIDNKESRARFMEEVCNYVELIMNQTVEAFGVDRI
jgi:hypothetical protein